MAVVNVIGAIRAIAELRVRMALHSLRRGSGLADLASAVIMSLLVLGVSIGIAVLLGFLVHEASHSGDLAALRRHLYTACFMFLAAGLILPFMLQNLHLGVDISRFRIFPIGKAWLYAIAAGSTLGSAEHVLYYPALASICIAGVVPLGVYAPLGFLSLLLFLLFNILAGNTAALVLETVMRKRRIREVAIPLLFVFVAFFSLFNALVDSKGREVSPAVTKAKKYLRFIPATGKILPPAIAADSIVDLHRGRAGSALTRILWLSLWVGGAAVCGYGFFSALAYGDRGSGRAARRKRELARAGTPRLDISRLSHLPPETFAAASMELRYLIRSPAGRLNVLLVPALTVFYVFALTRGFKSSFLGIRPAEVIVLGATLYIAFITSNFVCNAFRWEGGGIQTYFLSPAPLSRIIAGKNLGLALYHTVIYGVCLAACAAATSMAEPTVLVTAFLVFINAMASFFIVGNLLSIRFPAARDMSRMRCNSSQTAQLLSLVSFIGVCIILSASILIPYLTGIPILRPLILAVIFLLQMALYLSMLKVAARLMERYKERLIGCQLEAK